MRCIFCGDKVFSDCNPMSPRCEEVTENGILGFILCYKKKICMVNRFHYGGTRMAGYKHIHFYLNNFDSSVEYLSKIKRIGFSI